MCEGEAADELAAEKRKVARKMARAKKVQPEVGVATLAAPVQAGELIPYDPFNPEALKRVKAPEDAVPYDKVEDELGILQELPKMVSEHAHLSDQIKALEAKKDELKTDISARLMALSQSKLLVGRYSVTLTDPLPRKTLSKDKLLMSGVSVEVIENSYTSTTVKPSLLVNDLSQPRGGRGSQPSE